MKLSFLGAAGEVTGSCVPVETAEVRFLIDCGMFQGGREAPDRNRRRFGFDPAALDFVLLTHAHIDHSGLLPRLVREGFAGPIHATAVTIDLVGVMLPDSGHIQEMDAKRAARQPGRPIVRDPEQVELADVLLIESTYGDRAHRDQSATLIELEQVLGDTLRRGGNFIVPAFAVGRTQEILYHLDELARAGRLPEMQVYVDSPMATAATQITARHLALFDEEARALESWRRNANGRSAVRFVASAEESMALNARRSGAAIIAARGMCDAGRVRHHLAHNLPRAECSVLIAGFQAQGSLGRRLVDGARRVRIFGEEIPVRASIHTLGGLSAHADQPALLAWASHFRRAPRNTFVMHGEPASAQALAARLESDLGWRAVVPDADRSATF